MWSAPFRCTDGVGSWGRTVVVLRSSGSALASAVSVLGLLSVPATSWRAEVTPIRLHDAAGWGRPALDAHTVFYLGRRHELIAVDRRTRREAWRRPLAEDSDHTQGSRVVVHAGTVIAPDADLFAFDGQTGAPLWRLDAAAMSTSGRLLGDADLGAVFLGSYDGRLLAIDAASGQPRWRSATLGGSVTLLAPVAANGQVAAGYVDAGSGSTGGGVALFDGYTGSIIWQRRFTTGSRPRPLRFAGGPALLEGVAVAAASDGTLFGLDRRTGHVAWTMASADVGDAVSGDVDDYRALAVHGSSTLLAASLSGTLVSIATDTRRERWRLRSPPDGSIVFGLSVYGNTAFVPFASGRTVAVDLISGRERWRVGGEQQRFEWPAAAAGRQVYLTTEEGLYVVDENAL